MGRKATKAGTNVWYQARMEAAKWNDVLYSRDGAAEQVGMSADSIKNTELGLEKCMPVDKAVLLADLYKAPELLNYYCLNECPIGKNLPLSDEVVTLDRATVKLMQLLRTDKVHGFVRTLMDIVEDGKISAEERSGLDVIMDYLTDLMKVGSELKTLVGRMDERGIEGTD